MGCRTGHHSRRRTANKYGYLTTPKTYRDFDLRLKFKGEAAGNSVFFANPNYRHESGTWESRYGPQSPSLTCSTSPTLMADWSLQQHFGRIAASGVNALGSPHVVEFELTLIFSRAPASRDGAGVSVA